MKWSLNFVRLIFTLGPVLFIGLISYKMGDWYLLIGIPLYFIGFTLMSYKQVIFYFIPLFFVLWYWYTYGFILFDIVSLLFFCLSGGIAGYKIIIETERYVNRTLPEIEENIEFNQKVELLNQKIEQYKKEHPNETITPEILDNIKKDIFF